MKHLINIIASILLCLPVLAQDNMHHSDTISIEPMVSEQLQGRREATEAEKAYARQLAMERQEQQQIDENLPTVDENGQVVAGTDIFYPYLYSGFHYAPWHLHKGLNVNIGASVFANFGGSGNNGAGFTQDISLMYVTNLSKKATLAIGGYFNNMTWGGDNYTAAGVSAMLGYRFNEHWSAYAFVQKAFNSNNYAQLGWYNPYWGGYYPGRGYYGMGFGGYGMGAGSAYRNMDRIGAGLRYEWGEHNFIQIQVEVNRTPSQRGFGYNHHRYDYPVR